MSFDQQGYMYILDWANDRIQRWWPGASFGTTVAATTMNSPHSFRFDRQGNIVIADTNYHRVIRFGITCRKCHLSLHFLFVYQCDLFLC